MARELIHILILTALVAGTASAQRYPFRSYDSSQGLENLVVRTLVQDSDGFIWVGTGNGVFRYDGQRFEPYRGAEGLPGNSVRALHVDGSGTLWAGTYGGGPAYFARGRFHAFPLPEPAAFAQPGTIHSGPGAVYAATSNGLAVIAPARGQEPPKLILMARRPGAAGRETKVFGVHRSHSGTVWAGCGSSLCRLDGGDLVEVPSPGLPPANWEALSEDAGGDLWVRSSVGLFRRVRGAAKFEDMNGFVPVESRAVSLHQDHRGNIVVPTQLGLFIRRSDQWRVLDESGGLPAEPVNCALWDAEGNLWVGLDGFGVVKREGRGDWTQISRREGLSSNSATVIRRDHHGRLWVGSSYGLNLLDEVTGRWRTFRKKDGLAGDDVRAMAVGGDGAVYVGSQSGGLARVDPSTLRIRTLGEADGLPKRGVNNVFAPGDGSLWVGMRPGLYRLEETDRRRRFVRQPGPMKDGTESAVYALLKVRDGRLLSASRAGLMELRAGRWHRLEGLPLRDESLVFLAEDAPGWLWVGYDKGFGLTRLNWRAGEVEHQHFTYASDLSSDDLSFLESDSLGRIWAGTDNGLDVFDGKSWRRFRSGDGLAWLDTVLWGFWADTHGVVWISTRRGVSRYQEAREGLEPPPPVRVFITSASSRSGPLEVGEGGLIRVPAGNRSLELRFAATTFISESSVQFRYRMLDAEDGWVETAQRAVSLNLHGAGGRTFQVQARRPGEAWSEAAQASIDVAATWYESWWLRLLVAAVAAGLFWACWRWWLKIHMMRERELERLVAERTREVERLLVKAQEAGLLKDEFLANISHEIRTPMNAVLGMTSLALETTLDDEQRDYLQTVESSARELLQLLNKVLDFSKIESGRLTLEDIPYEPAALTDTAVRTMEPLALAKKLELRASLDPELPANLLGDPAKVRQVLLNLLSNAIKFTDRGWVACSAKLVRGEGGDRVRYSVADTGIGVAVDKHDVIFEAFRQADGSTTRRYGGTGLGLSISKRLVEAMGGAITLHSEPGCGAEFSFELPLVRADGASHPHSSQPVASSISGLAALNSRVLLVEDNEIGRRLSTRLLEKMGCQVTTAADGAESIELVKREQFDVVLLDLQMPGVDGIHATKEMRAIDSELGRRTPIVILTANAGAADRHRAIEAGADDFLVKPIDFAALNRVLAGNRREQESDNR